MKLDDIVISNVISVNVEFYAEDKEGNPAGIYRMQYSQIPNAYIEHNNDNGKKSVCIHMDDPKCELIGE